MNNTIPADQSGDHSSHPQPNYIGIFATLLVLTIVTVALSRVNLGGTGNLVLAIAVATFKATLILLYFMHMKFEKILMFSLLIIPALLAVVFVFGLVPDMVNHEGARTDDVPGGKPVQEAH